MLNEVLGKIEKDFGKGLVMKLGEVIFMFIDVILIGVIGLDIVIGIGGLFRGRIVEVYGLEFFGKIIVVFSCVVLV